MKTRNFLMIGMILLSIGMLSGCQSSSDATQKQDMVLNQDKRMGVIESLGGAHVSSQATHLLRMDDGNTLFLKSSAVDLPNVKYAGKEVEVAGTIIRTTDGNEVMDVMNIDIVDRDTTAVPQDTAPQWVDYASDSLQVGLKYRDDYKIQENADSLVLTKTEKPTAEINLDAVTAAAGDAPTTTPKKEAMITIKVISKDSNYNLLETMGVPSDSSADLSTKGYSKSKITQKALDAYKQANTDGTQINYFIKSGFSYQLGFTGGDSATLVTDQNMFYDVLASINFGTNLGMSGSTATTSATATTPATTTAVATTTGAAPTDFQNFTSEAMKFSIQYPKGYYFGNTVSQTAGATRSYAFSTKPADDKSGELITLDLMKGSLPSGTKADLGNGKQAVEGKAGSLVTVAINWNNGQFFQLSGPSDQQKIMEQMASSITF